jgi:hypothetical protein
MAYSIGNSFVKTSRKPWTTSFVASFSVRPRLIRPRREMLDHRNGSTDEAWDALAARLAQLGSRAERFRVRYEVERDEEGNLVVERRHRPSTPLRRPPRFHPVAA